MLHQRWTAGIVPMWFPAPDLFSKGEQQYHNWLAWTIHCLQTWSKLCVIHSWWSRRNRSSFKWSGLPRLNTKSKTLQEMTHKRSYINRTCNMVSIFHSSYLIAHLQGAVFSEQQNFERATVLSQAEEFAHFHGIFYIDHATACMFKNYFLKWQFESILLISL